MTAQYRNKLVNDSDLDLGYLELVSVDKAYPIEPRVPETAHGCSALWRGYIATLRIDSCDRLELVQFDFPFDTEKAPPQMCHAYFFGDFRVTFEPFRDGPQTHIPFNDGTINRDRNTWEIEDQTVEAVFSRVLRNRTTQKASGLLADLGDGYAFVPKSRVPQEFKNNLDDLIGRKMRFEILMVDKERSNVVLGVLE